eukprot:sb/3470125/
MQRYVIISRNSFHSFLMVKQTLQIYLPDFPMARFRGSSLVRVVLNIESSRPTLSTDALLLSPPGDAVLSSSDSRNGLGRNRLDVLQTYYYYRRTTDVKNTSQLRRHVVETPYRRSTVALQTSYKRNRRSPNLGRIFYVCSASVVVVRLYAIFVKFGKTALWNALQSPHARHPFILKGLQRMPKRLCKAVGAPGKRTINVTFQNFFQELTET